MKVLFKFDGLLLVDEVECQFVANCGNSRLFDLEPGLKTVLDLMLAGF